jgi:release factor glutamine methyltransferase
MLAQVVSAQQLAVGSDVLDVFTGSGALALAASLSGARSVTAVDLSRRALLTVRLNARRNGVRVRTMRGDLFAPLSGETFDLILANPPYFPGDGSLPRHGLARAWEGGHDGRMLVDRVCAEVASHLRPGGRLLIVQNTMIGERETCERLERSGLHTEVLLRHRGPLGPVGRAAAALLRRRGSANVPGDDGQEEIVVISALSAPR